MKYFRASSIAALAVLAGCATGRMSSPDAEEQSEDAMDADSDGEPDGSDQTDDTGAVDAPPLDAGVDGRADAAPQVVDAAPDAPPAVQGTSLVLTEVALTGNPAEFIEIANPTDTAVSLSNYYLSDSGEYFRLPAGMTLPTSDFIVKFPAGASIGPRAVITVAVSTASNFMTTYGTAPTYAMDGGTMVRVVGTNAATLTNDGEPIILFTWDGTTDLVRDVDILLVGTPGATNLLSNKSGVAIDGPDADTATSAYRTDARTMLAQAGAPGMSQSTKRIAGEAGHELQTGGGNGIVGDDETTEDTRATWDATFTTATPGTVPATLLP